MISDLLQGPVSGRGTEAASIQAGRVFAAARIPLRLFLLGDELPGFGEMETEIVIADLRKPRCRPNPSRRHTADDNTRRRVLDQRFLHTGAAGIQTATCPSL